LTAPSNARVLSVATTLQQIVGPRIIIAHVCRRVDILTLEHQWRAWQSRSQRRPNGARWPAFGAVGRRGCEHKPPIIDYDRDTSLRIFDPTCCSASPMTVFAVNRTRAWTGEPTEFEEFSDRASEPRAILDFGILQ
jgi:hypothetical protein